jgi:hypothetical protein
LPECCYKPGPLAVWLFWCLVVLVFGIQFSDLGFQVKVSQFDQEKKLCGWFHFGHDAICRLG